MSVLLISLLIWVVGLPSVFGLLFVAYPAWLRSQKRARRGAAAPDLRKVPHPLS